MAPVLVVVCNRIDCGNAMADSVCATLPLVHASTDDGLPPSTVTPRKGDPVTYVD